MLTDQQFGVPAADERQEQNAVGPVAELKGIAGKQDQRHGATLPDLRQQVVQHVIDHQTSTDKKIIDPAFDRDVECLLHLFQAQLIRVEEDGKPLPALFFCFQQAGINALIVWCH